MQPQEISFRSLLDPLRPEEFFERYYRNKPVHVPGRADKFAQVFSWEEFNRLLNTTNLWSDRSMKMALDGRTLASQEFCVPALSREGQEVMRPDPRRISEHLCHGATLVLDLIETLTPQIATVANSLEMVTGAPVSCNAYCSWKEHQGFSSHFDTMEVLALHIYGQKTWRIYEGRAESPVDIAGFNCASVPPEERERAKGKILLQVAMKPGDLLYVPKGQYHDALCASEASLHLSFGIVEPTGLDFITILLRSLPMDPLFRQTLPSFDDVEAHQAHLRKLGERLREIVTRPQISAEMRQYQRQRACCDCSPGFGLPTGTAVARYRVRCLEAKLVRRGGDWLLKTASAKETLSGEEAEVASWVLRRDYFNGSDLSESFAARDPAALRKAVDRLARAGLIERI